ncbi:unnamed protein product, partial [Didymodactylos carnosus]
ATGSHDHTVFIYNLQQPIEKPLRLRGHFSNVRALAFSTEGYLASASWDRMIIIWKYDTGHLKMRLLGHMGWIQDIAFAIDGIMLASIADDDTIRLWNVTTGSCLAVLYQTLTDLSCYVRFLPCGKLLAGGAVYQLHALQSLPKSQKWTTINKVRDIIMEDGTNKLAKIRFPPSIERKRSAIVNLPKVKQRAQTHHSLRRK